MPPATITPATLKRALREALAETLHDERDLLHEIVAEALEDFALAEAIRQGKQSKPASRESVIRALRAKA